MVEDDDKQWISLRCSQDVKSTGRGERIDTGDEKKGDMCSESCSVMSDSLRPYELYSLWNSLGQNTGVGSLSLLQGTFPTQEANPGLPIAGGFFTI